MTQSHWDELKSILLPELYQPIEHPDFDGWNVKQPCVERWEMIQREIGAAGRMVDLGCHTGWFCRQFARLGWTTWGIDKSADHIEIAREMDAWANIPKTEYLVANLLETYVQPADVVLCLSVSMYLFEDRDRGWNFFDELSQKCERMFMDFGGMYADRLPFDKLNVIDQMLDRTEFKSGQLLGNSGFEERPLYVFQRAATTFTFR